MHERTRLLLGRTSATVALLLAVAAGMAVGRLGTDQHRRDLDTAVALSHANPTTGRQVILGAGCGACHEIPGIMTARGRIGPSLDGVAARAMVGGVLPNTPDNLAS